MPVQRKPLTWTDPGGARHACGFCGAVYAVSPMPLPDQDRDEPRCLVCKQVLDDWNVRVCMEYTLLEEPDIKGSAH